MTTARRRAPEDVDDGVRASHDAYDAMPLDPLSVRRDAYRDHKLRPLGVRVHDLPLRRCPGCQSRNAAPVGYGPAGRVVYCCSVCRRRFYADTE